MFCMNCGQTLPEGAKFCKFCGTPQDAVAPAATTPSTINLDQSTKLVPGTCTNCGASLQVDPSLQAAICPACGTPYIVQQAINSFNISSIGNISVENAVFSIPGGSAENLIKRAISFEYQYDLEKALEYYNKVLDVDAANQDALVSVERINKLLANYWYKIVPVSTSSDSVFSSTEYGNLMLNKNELIFATKARTISYKLFLITNIEHRHRLVVIYYNGKSVSYVAKDPGAAGDMASDITKAKMGVFPRTSKETIAQQPNYPAYHNEFSKFLSSKDNQDYSKDFNSRAESELKEKLKTIRVGEEFKFGSYNGQYLNWRVLRIQDRKAIIISTKAICTMPYHQPGGDTTWSECTLRKWLNSEFYNDNFSQVEKECIIPSNLNNENNPNFNTPGGVITTDNIFLLSIDEAKTYFANRRARAENSLWWLRSPGSLPNYAVCVYTNGEIMLGGRKVYDDRVGFQKGLGVRPAMWLKLD